MPLVVEANLRTKKLHVSYDTNTYGTTELSFPMLRCRVCTECQRPVSVWAVGSTAKLPDLQAHRGEWRVHSVKGGFVLASPQGHDFDNYGNPRCQCETSRDALGNQPVSGRPVVNLGALAALDGILP